MSSKRTNNLNMYVWARADALSVEEFNSNFNKLDAEVSAKASKADIAGKADKAEVAQVTAQLADTVKEVNGVKPTNGKVTIPVPEVDTSKLATKQELQNIGSATPKGTYATVAALQTAFPTGTNGIYVVTADGKWYYWNGTAWTAGGVYQSTAIGAKTVTPETTTFINNKLSLTLERGTITNGANDDKNLTVRVRSKETFNHEDGLYIVRKSPNYLIGVITYNNGVYDGIDRGWIDKDAIEIDKGKQLRINIRKRNDAEITDSEITDIQGSIEIKYNFQSADKKDLQKQTQEIQALKEDLKTDVPLKNEDFTLGTISAGEFQSNTTTRIRVKNKIRVLKGDVIKFLKSASVYNYGIAMYNSSGGWNGVDYGWLSKGEFVVPEDGYIGINARYVDNRAINSSNFADISEGTFQLRTSHKLYTERKLSSLESQINNQSPQKILALNSIIVEYGRKNNASYVFVRIPKHLNDGSKLVPKVALTSVDGSIGGAKRSTLDYSKANDTIFTVNAGLFNTTTNQPVGQTIINGVSIVNTPMTSDNGVPISDKECYPLAIDASNNLTTYPRDADTADMIAAGVKYAITGWGRLVKDFVIDQESINGEIVHGKKKYIRQSIGQYQNGDYCVCTVDMTRGPVTNEAGLYYEDLAQIFIDKGVKFAYSLDGGGSAQTVMGKRQLNPIYEGATGRAVPTVITFAIG